jgi:homoserine dehydrogenase
MRKIRVGLMGLGTVGTGVVRLIEGHQDDLRHQTGMAIEIGKILVRDKEKDRSIHINANLLTEDPYELLEDTSLDVIVEVMGGIDPTREYLLTALENRKHIVTANKDLIALHGAELLEKAVEKKCDLFYEASVAGGIPIIRALVEGLSSDRVRKMMGIVNGTTNYILTKMTESATSFDEVLKEAQELGYAEADPSSDVDGLDAARKMAILSTLGFHVDMDLRDVAVQGIRDVTLKDIHYALALDYNIKLLGIAERNDGYIEVSVAPTMIHKSHPLANVNGVYNAVYVYGEAVGETMFYGPGAGELPTATAVVADLVTVVKNIGLGVNGRGMVAPYREKRLKSPEQMVSKYFIRLAVEDEVGVLAKVTQLLAENRISLEKVLQEPVGGRKAEIILITHYATKADLKEFIKAIEATPVVERVESFYRVEGGN